MPENSTSVIGRQVPWKSVKNVPLRIKHVTNLAQVTAAGEVQSANFTMPYALLTVENGGGQPTDFLLPVTHRLDFLNLRSIYEVRGVRDNEEVLVTHTPLGGFLGLFIAKVQPSLTFAIYPAGHLERIVDSAQRGAVLQEPLAKAYGLQTTITNSTTHSNKRLQKAAEQHDADAQLLLGVLYDHWGRRSLPDDGEPVWWLRMAAKQNFAGDFSLANFERLWQAEINDGKPLNPNERLFIEEIHSRVAKRKAEMEAIADMQAEALAKHYLELDLKEVQEEQAVARVVEAEARLAEAEARVAKAVEVKAKRADAQFEHDQAKAKYVKMLYARKLADPTTREKTIDYAVNVLDVPRHMLTEPDDRIAAVKAELAEVEAKLDGKLYYMDERGLWYHRVVPENPGDPVIKVAHPNVADVLEAKHQAWLKTPEGQKEGFVPSWMEPPSVTAVS